MAIIISKDGKNAEKLDQSHFGLEDKLQQYIYDNPDSIPLYDIDEDTRLFIAAREFSTKSGPIDALGFDASGNIYVVETKLYKNPDKRTVVAQALDYGASLWRHSVDFEQFIQQLDSHCQKQFDISAEFFQLESADDAISSIKSNLSDGSIKFVVLMDKLHDALKDLVIFVNQNSKFDLYAVELEYYKHASFEIIIPKLYGAEVKKEVISNKRRNESTLCDEGTFLKVLKTGSFDSSVISVEQAIKIHELNKKMLGITGGRVEYDLSQRNGEDFVKSFYIDDKYNFEFESNCMISFFPYQKSTPMVNTTRKLYELIVKNKLFGKDESTINSPRYYISPGQMNKTEDINRFIALYEELLEEV